VKELVEREREVNMLKSSLSLKVGRRIRFGEMIRRLLIGGEAAMKKKGNSNHAQRAR
jgi:hypothetical protein